MQEMWVPSLGREGPPERKWQPTPVSLPGKSHGQSSLAGYSHWSYKGGRHDLVTKQQQQIEKHLVLLTLKCFNCEIE